MLGLGLAAGAALFAMTNRLLENNPSTPRWRPGPVASLPSAAAAASAAARCGCKVATAPPHAAAGSAAAAHAAARSRPGLARTGRSLESGARLRRTLQGVAEGTLVLLHQQNLSLALIRELERPGILTLDAASGTPSYALLTGLTRDSATLRAAGTEQKVTLTALAARWQATFATLWQAPPGYPASWPARKNPRLDGRATGSGERIDGTCEPACVRRRAQVPIASLSIGQGLAADGQPGPGLHATQSCGRC